MEEIGTEFAVQLIKPEKHENGGTTFTLQTNVLEKLLLDDRVRDRNTVNSCIARLNSLQSKNS